ncbi:penicillin-binding transpeptidase domain-containing protein [Alteribacillus sp. HJP-4]|uniref:penicillin-binding transpeptidase domain-containing protein n=1 Tax=Alteribacillus sp. HJP-4 TaxID=2775394 RepID=UPI0035CD1DF1
MKQGKNYLPIRLNLLFFAVFILFSALILRLGFIQIVQGDDFERDLEESSTEAPRIDAPRGLMYDRNGELVVDNALVLSLTYTNEPGVSEEERIEIAQELSNYVEIGEDEIEDITERDLQDYWLTTREEQAEELTDQEDLERAEEHEIELYDIQLERITEEMLEDISDEELTTVAIWREMISGYNHSPQRIKKGITREEAHRISERLDNLPGVDILRDAQRQYLYEDAFPSFFGRTNSIPRENLDEYLAEGYDRSDEVGTSFLEEQYESALRGQKGEVTSDSSGNETNGSRGNDIVLSIDMALQQDIEAIIDEEIGASSGSFIEEEEAYVVMMEPHTGEVLTVSGYDDHLGTVSSSFEMGSTVKGATVMVGMQTGVVTPETFIYDSPLDLGSQTPTISSVSNLGSVNYLTALERSSNIYMARIAMRMAGYDESNRSWGDWRGAYDKLRYYFEQFGLGSPTGVDLPSEATGLNGGYGNPGNLLYLSFGQFDTYTPMQLAQYVSTIANNGYRVEPNFVKSIHEANKDKNSLGPVRHQFESDILNKIDIDDNYIQLVKDGFYQVVNGSRGTARSYFQNTDYTASGKTGTAEITRNGVEGNNQAFVGFAPYDDPEVAISVIVPGVYKDSDGGRQGIANTIARRSLDAYFDLREGRPEMEPETDTDVGENVN